MTAARKTQRTIATLPYEDLVLGDEVGFENPRTASGLNKASIVELANSIAADGLQDPLVVWCCEKDKVVHNVIVRGQRRYRAIGLLIEQERAGALQKGVPVTYVHAPDLLSAHRIALIDVAQRVELSSAELAEAMEKLHGLGLNQKEIAKSLNKSETWVSRIMSAYASAIPALRTAWRRGDIPDVDAKQLASMPAEQQERLLAEYVATRKSGGRAARGEAKKKLDAAPRPRVTRKGEPGKEISYYVRLAGLYRDAMARKGKKLPDYVRGMLHAFRFAIGEEDENVFEKAWSRVESIARRLDRKK